MVLPRRPGGSHHHICTRPLVEKGQLHLMARRLWCHESRAAGDWHQLLILVGGECDIQRMAQAPETRLVVEIQYVPPSVPSYLAIADQLDYVLSAALDSGVAMATVIIFFCITLPAGSLSWWGNTVYSNTADGKGTPWKSLPPSGFFGPDKWE